jgi:hypothetical protein
VDHYLTHAVARARRLISAAPDVWTGGSFDPAQAFRGELPKRAVKPRASARCAHIDFSGTDEPDGETRQRGNGSVAIAQDVAGPTPVAQGSMSQKPPGALPETPAPV